MKKLWYYGKNNCTKENTMVLWKKNYETLIYYGKNYGTIKHFS